MKSGPVIRKARGLAAVFIIAGFMITPSVAAVEQGGLGGRPAYPKADNPRSQSIFVHKLNPGQEAKDGVEVINGTDKTKRVMVYAVDSQVSSGGAFACAQAVDKPLSVGSWVHFDTNELTIAPKQKQVVAFTVKAPKDVTPGEHNGCIVMQDTEQQRASDSNGIVLSMRSAIRLAITVPGDIQKGLILAGVGVSTKDEKKVLMSTNLRNNGNVSLDTKLHITLSYAFGGAVASARGDFPVLSNNDARFNFEGGRPFWGGWYRLSATVMYNDSPRISIGEGDPNTRIEKSKWVFISPQSFAAALEGAFVVAIGGAVIRIMQRRHTHKRITRQAQTHTVSAGEDVHAIAEKYGMTWKVLVRVNKLKAPYQLKSGQRLVVAPDRPRPRKPKRS